MDRYEIEYNDRLRTMTAICFVCNLPIQSHQVGLEWTGGNGWDDLVREQVEELTLKQRLGTGRRDSAAQISPDNENINPPITTQRGSRRMSITEFLGWPKTSKQSKLQRRDTFADITKRQANNNEQTSKGFFYNRRESSVDSGIKSQVSAGRTKRELSITELKNDFYKLWNKSKEPPQELTYIAPRRDSTEYTSNTRRSSNDSSRSRRDSTYAGNAGESRRHKCRHHLRRQSQQSVDLTSSNSIQPKYNRNDQRPSGSSNDSSACNAISEKLESQMTQKSNDSDRSSSLESKPQAKSETRLVPTSLVPTKVTTSTSPDNRHLFLLDPAQNQPPMIITSPVTPPSVSPSANQNLTIPGKPTSGGSTPVSPSTPTGPLLTGRRDSQTQCSYNRKDSRRRLPRQTATVDESISPGGGRRSSQPTLSPGSEDCARRDSLSPDQYPRRRDSKSHLSPDRNNARDASPIRGDRRRSRLRQSMSMASGRPPRSPDSSSCSSRDPSPCARPPSTHPPVKRRPSRTDEIMMSRGFRRQSTIEETIKCRNFRRQSSQSDDQVTRLRGRRDSSAQITNGTVESMTIETTSTLFDTSTQTDPSPLYDNNHYHEECLKCNSCGLNLTGPKQNRARRFKNQILCDLHFADVALMECSDFMQQLRSFKPQSLGCAVARRKSSTTLIFPLPPQACSSEFCSDFPHNFKVTPGYWIECSRQHITSETLWDESESDKEATDPEQNNEQLGGSSCMINKQRSDYCFIEENEIEGDEPSRKKTTIEEQWDKNQCFELTSVEQETYEKYFYGTEHWNYFTNDEDLGPVILSIKQETINGRDQFRILVRAISYTVHGLIPASCVFADRYNREEVVRSLGKEVNINPPLTLGQLPDTPEELLKLDQVFIKSELKVGVIYVKEGQTMEEEILDNNDESQLFTEFLSVLGDRVRLKGFDKYKGGLDTVHDLTGFNSIYTNWRGIEIMFHVSTLLPYEERDPQKLQRKRHIGNDIVCVVFLEADNTSFTPACIKSHFLHTFILVRVSPRIKRKITRYEISVVTRDEVGAYKPYLWEQSVFEKGPMFREWILTKIVNGERASYSAPKFARMQERTRSQMLEDIVANLQNHVETGQIPKPYRRGSWRPIGHMRPSSPLLDSVRDQFEDYDQLAKDFTKVFLNSSENLTINANLFDVSFLVPGPQKQKVRFVGVRAILGVRSRVFQEMLYGIQAGFGSPQVPVAELLSRPAPTLLSPQKPKSSNFLQVPDVETPSVPSSPMVKRAFYRLGTLTDRWSKSIRGKHGTLHSEDRKRWSSSHDYKEMKEKEKAAQSLALPRLSVCADAQKVDRAKLAKTEFDIIEFDPDTFRILLDYLHTGSCPLTCSNIPGLICAAEHYDLPELLQACFHHAKQFLHIEIVCVMLSSLENYFWRYTSAMELINMILVFVETRALQLFQNNDFLTLSESMVQMIMNRSLEVVEIKKFEAMLAWAQNRIKQLSPDVDANVEFKRIMERLSRDLKLYRITPQELIKIVLPTKSIRNERILETLMFQATSGIYRNVDSYLEDYKNRIENQDSFDAGL